MSEKAKIRISRLDSVGGIINEMGRVYRQARRGQLDTSEATRLVFILRSIRGAIEGQARRINGLIRIDDMGEEELLQLLGGEPDAEGLGAAASVDPAANGAARDDLL